LEVYDYPGGYAKRFDGVDSGGGDNPADLQHIFQDNGRTAQIRIGEEAAASLYISATASSLSLLSGHTFELTGPQAGPAAGTYLLVEVDRNVVLPAGAEATALQADNKLRCLPGALPFRPQRTSPRPVAPPQTATVVGPAGEKIFTDKYGRVKVQFHWDRQGQNDANSSCWIRVSQASAGKLVGWVI